LGGPLGMGYNFGQMDDLRNLGLLTELRYALDVLEERSHLGLDEEGASTVRRILLRQIAKTTDTPAPQSAPAAPFEYEVFVEDSTHTLVWSSALHRLYRQGTHH